MSFDTLFYLALFAAGLFLMMRFCGGHAAGRAQGGAMPVRGGRANGPRRAAADNVDPVCGMPVDTATALSAVHDGKTYSFCSPPCRDKFLAAPASYALASAAAPARARRHQGCC